MTTAAARILVVQAEPSVRAALAVALRSAGHEVTAVADGTELAAHLDRRSPDLVVLDGHLPVGPDGWQLARQVRARATTPLMFLTRAESLQDRLAAFALGADDYVLQPFAMAEVLARVQALLRRAGRLPCAVWQAGDLVVDDAARSVVVGGVTVGVTRTEYLLLSVLVQHVGRVLSKATLHTQVWGFDTADDNLVEVHISGLRRKLEQSGPRLIHTVRGSGYVLRA